MNNLITWLCVAITSVVVCGCSKETTAEVPSGDKDRTGDELSASRFVSAEEVVDERVKQLGPMTGVVLGRGVWGEQIDPSKITEKVRNDAADKAILMALGDIAESVGTTVLDHSTISRQLLNGAKVIASAESIAMSARNEYMVAVAVVWSPKLESEAVKIMKGESANSDRKRGKYSLDEWLGEQNAAFLNIPKNFIDANGDAWLVGAVTDDSSMNNFLLSWARGEEFKKICGDEERYKDDEDWIRKAYAAFVATKLISMDVEVEASMKIHAGVDGDAKEYEDEEMFKQEYNASWHLLTISTSDWRSKIQAAPRFFFSIDNDRIKWFQREYANPFTGKKPTMLICAVRARDIAGVEGR